MRNESLLVRGSAISIRFTYFLLFVLLFLPTIQSPGEPLCIGWQSLLFVCNPSPSDLVNYYLPNIWSYVFIALMKLMVLLWPPLASMIVFRSRWRAIGLVGLWVSLPLILGPCLIETFAALTFSWTGAFLARHLLLLVLSSGFALSFIACLILALRLPLIGTHEQTSLAVSPTLHGACGQHEEAEQIASSSRVDERAPVAGSGFRLLFAFIGLLCHVAIGLSLFFTYTETYDPYGSGTSPYDTTTFTTGWQLLGEAFQRGVLTTIVATVLLAALVLPMPIYLSQLFFWRRERAARLLSSSLSLSRVLGSIGLSLSGVLLMFSLIFRGGDLHDPVSTTHLAFAVPPVAFLLSFLCSSILIGSGFRLGTRRQ
jgi:hypothetical protein